MKVINEIKSGTPTKFIDLNVGEAYYDKTNILCIKTGEVDGNYGTCIAYIGEEWETDEEYKDSEVKPLRTCITILGYK